jgi:hypothetical protein
MFHWMNNCINTVVGSLFCVGSSTYEEIFYLYYYIKHLRIEEFIFCHGNFLLYPFYSSIKRIIFIFG